MLSKEEEAKIAEKKKAIKDAEEAKKAAKKKYDDKVKKDTTPKTGKPKMKLSRGIILRTLFLPRGLKALLRPIFHMPLR